MPSQTQVPVELKKSNHWVKISCDGNSDRKEEVLTLKDVSSDFIKGVYCALNDPYDNVEYDDDVTMESDLKLEGCVIPDIIASWGDGNYFEQFCGLDQDSDGEYIGPSIDDIHNDKREPYRTKILSDPKKYNKRWKRFLKEYRSDIDKVPTKRYCAFIQTGDNDHIMQFDTIDFLNGFEMIRMWAQNQSSWFYTLYLTSVFDSGKVCRTQVTYQSLQKDKEYFDHIFLCANKYLPTELAKDVVRNLAQACYGYDKKVHNTYDECTTLCRESVCHIHREKQVSKGTKKNKSLRLKHCLARIKLEKL